MLTEELYYAPRRPPPQTPSFTRHERRNVGRLSSKTLSAICALLSCICLNAHAEYRIYTRTVVQSTTGPVINEFDQTNEDTNHSAELHSTVPQGSMSAFASVDLSSGSLRINASCTTRPQECEARASFVDTLTFDLTQVPAGQLIPVEFTARIEGTFGKLSDPNFSFFLGSLIAQVGYRTTQLHDDVATPEGFSVFGKNGDFQEFTPNYFRGQHLLRGGEVNSFHVIAELIGRTDVNFSNTAFFSLTSPIAFTSDSGVFLSNPIPIPASIWLFGSVISLLALKLRRKA